MYRTIVSLFVLTVIVDGFGVSKSAIAQESAGDAANETNHLAPDPNVGPIQSNDRDGSGRPRFARVSKGDEQLPSLNGQFWQEYDIRPYSKRVKSGQPGEQAIVDWILRETGTDNWFRSPGGFLEASSAKIRVYHNPEIQTKVAEIVDRFVSNTHSEYAITVRLVTVRDPSWRQAAIASMIPLNVHSSGVQAWMMAKEQAAVMQAGLKNSPGYVQHNSPNLMVGNGSVHSIERFMPRNYRRAILPSKSWPGYTVDSARINEGYSIRISPLMTLDKNSIDVALKCRVEQIEKMESLPIPTPYENQTGRLAVDIPQVSTWQIHERFRWPIDKVLLVNRRIVAMPGLRRSANLPVVSQLVKTRPKAADALLFLEVKRIERSGVARKGAEYRTSQLDSRGRY